MSNPLFPADMTTEQRIELLQVIQRRSQQLTDALEQSRHLSLVDLQRLSAEYDMFRARQMLLWHLQGDAIRQRAFNTWPTFLIDDHCQQTTA